MPGYYTYFISSLPMLHFEARPPFSSERFLRMCRGIISDGDTECLKDILQEGGRAEGVFPEAEKKWRVFDTALRNELVKIRAARKHIDPAKYTRGDGCADPSITHAALHAHRTPSVIEAEKLLDMERWRALDELSAGHYFDMDFLVIYARKLSILERWEKINTADKKRELEKAVA